MHPTATAMLWIRPFSKHRSAYTISNILGRIRPRAIPWQRSLLAHGFRLLNFNPYQTCAADTANKQIPANALMRLVSS